MNTRDSITRRSFLGRLAAGGAMAAAAPYILPSQPAGAAEAKRLDVRTFGAKGDGAANDAPAINRAIAEGVRLGPGATVFIPKGRYRLDRSSGGHVNINDARGLAVVGEPGSVLLATDPNDSIVRLSKCTGTTLKGLTLEQEKTYFTQGTVEAMAADGKSCDVSIDKRYDEPDAPHLAALRTLRSFSYSDTTSYRQDRWWPTVKTRTRTGDRQWHFEIEGWALTKNMVKKPFILWDDKHGSHGVSLESCQDCVIEDVTYYGRGTNAGLFLMRCSGTTTIRGYRNLTPPRTRLPTILAGMAGSVSPSPDHSRTCRKMVLSLHVETP